MDDPAISKPTNKRFILPSWLLVVLLIIIFPLGVILMWFFSPWKASAKLVITFGPIALMTILSIILVILLNQANEGMANQALQSGLLEIPTTTTPAASGQEASYHNDDLGFSLTVPDNWSIRVSKDAGGSADNELVFIASPDSRYEIGTVIEVFMDDNVSNHSFNDYVSKDYLPSFTTAPKPLRDLTINGAPAKQILESNGTIETMIYGGAKIYFIDYYQPGYPGKAVDYSSVYQDITKTFSIR